MMQSPDRNHSKNTGLGRHLLSRYCKTKPWNGYAVVAIARIADAIRIVFGVRNPPLALYSCQCN